MITGDNPMTAAAIAAEAGVDDFLAQATPEDKLKLHPRRAGQGQARRDVRRRHQRRAGARPGRRRRGDEHRHGGGPRGRQHDRPRQRPDQAHRDRGDRQAAADDARRADDLLDRQRRRQIFRDHPGDVPRLLSAARCAERDAAALARERDPLGDHLQRADHRRADPARLEGRHLPGGRRRRAAAAATCSSTGSAASSYPSSASRSSTSPSPPSTSPEAAPMFNQLRPALVVVIA